MVRFPSFFVLLLLGASTAFSQSPQEQKLFDMTNQARAEQGLKPLVWDDVLATAARKHSQLMVDQKLLSHQLSGEADLQTRAAQAGAHFHVIAENIAMGSNADEIQKEWMHSAPHRSNILDPQTDHAGVGVVEKNGYWYATVDFDADVAAMAPEQIEQKVAAILRQKGIDPSGPAEAARKDCTTDEGDMSGLHALFVMRWEATSLDRLPPPLEQRIATGKYKTAAVGACPAGELSQGGNQGFTTYRMIVLLY